MPTFEITINIGYRTNLSLLMSLVAIEGIDMGIGVCSLLESRATIVKRPLFDKHKPSDTNNELLNVTKCSLVGRASIFNVDCFFRRVPYLNGAFFSKEYSLRSRPKTVKSVEIIQSKMTVDNPSSPSWTGTLSIDIPMLQLLNEAELLPKSRGFSELEDWIYWFDMRLDKFEDLVDMRGHWKRLK